MEMRAPERAGVLSSVPREGPGGEGGIGSGLVATVCSRAVPWECASCPPQVPCARPSGAEKTDLADARERDVDTKGRGPFLAPFFGLLGRLALAFEALISLESLQRTPHRVPGRLLVAQEAPHCTPQRTRGGTLCRPSSLENQFFRPSHRQLSPQFLAPTPECGFFRGSSSSPTSP